MLSPYENLIRQHQLGREYESKWTPCPCCHTMVEIETAFTKDVGYDWLFDSFYRCRVCNSIVRGI